MSTAFSAAYEVPADVESAWRALSGDRWAPALAAHLRDDSRALRVEATTEGGALLEVSRALPAGVPGWLQGFLPADGRVVQTDVWQPAREGVRRGTWSATFAGAPGSATGTMLLEPVDAAARWTVEGDLHVRVPVLGRRAEALLAPLLARLVERQGEVLAGLVSPAAT